MSFGPFSAFYFMFCEQIKYVTLLISWMACKRLWHPTFVHFGLDFECHTKVLHVHSFPKSYFSSISPSRWKWSCDRDVKMFQASVSNVYCILSLCFEQLSSIVLQHRTVSLQIKYFDICASGHLVEVAGERNRGDLDAKTTLLCTSLAGPISQCPLLRLISTLGALVLQIYGVKLASNRSGRGKSFFFFIAIIRVECFSVPVV